MNAIHRIDARLKILACGVYAVAVVTTPSGEWVRLFLYIGPALAVSLLARLRLREILTRSAAVVPFSLLAALFLPFATEGRNVVTFNLLWARLEITREGLEILGQVVTKSWLSVVGMAMLSSTTRPGELVAALRRLGLPPIMAGTLFLTLRYLVLLTNEAKQMERARRCRAVRPWYRWGMGSTAGMVASLFIRAWETGERVHLAMLSRGFSGQMREASTRRPSFGGVAACASFALVVGAIRVWGRNW